MYKAHFKNQKEVIIYSKNRKIDLCIDVLFIKRIRRDEKVLRSAFQNREILYTKIELFVIMLKCQNKTNTKGVVR